MKKSKGMSVKLKLAFCVSFLSIITLIVGGIGIGSIISVAQRGEYIYSEGLMPCLYLAGIEQELADIQSEYLNMAYGGKEAELENLKEKIESCKSIIDQYEVYVTTDTVKELYQLLKTNFDTYRKDVYTHINALENQESTVNNNVQIMTISDQEDAVQTVVNKLMEIAKDTARTKEEDNTLTKDSALKFLSGIMLIGIVISSIVAYSIVKGISGAIGRVIEAVEEVSTGNLDIRLNVDTGNELGAVAQNFDKMVQNLSEVIMNIEAASEQVHMGARQVAHTSSLLAEGATEQATTVEELTTAVEEINTQIKQNADHANTMNHIAIQTQHVVEKSHLEMEQMLRAMEDINHSSSEVSKIIKVIDDIAFQTNILALNAAVEAARAGQHGKGFTVVAEEVRNLAARSAEAAKETTSMIESSIRNAQIGMELAQGAAIELGHVVEGIKEVVDLTNEISISCSEQSNGMEQINEGAQQISNVVQSNTATSQEAAAASEELAGQAELMRGEVGRFRIPNRYTATRNNYSYSETYLRDELNRGSSGVGDTDFGKY